MKYTIGLDIGIASVGYSILELNEEEIPIRIHDLGVRIFDKAEHPKNGASLAAPRREARGARRRLRRKKHRIERIKNQLLAHNVLNTDTLLHLYDGDLEDIYKLRTEALDRKLNNKEFARVLIHLAQRRGFRSNRKNDKQAEAGKILNAIEANKELIQKKGYRTVGEMLYKDEKYSACKRNKEEAYLSTVQRDMVQDEAVLIFQSQRQLGSPYASETLEQAYLEILLSQRSFEDGPACGPYAGDQIEKMIGYCTFETNEKRAAKASYSFEYFNLLQKINHIRILDPAGNSLPLTNEQREKIIRLAHKSPKPTYGAIRKEIGLSHNYIFNITYGEDWEADEKKEKFSFLNGYHAFRVAFDKIAKGHITTIDKAVLNQIGYIFTVYKTDAKIQNALEQLDLSKEEVAVLVEHINGFSKFGHLSVTACNKIIPFLEQGMTYDKACDSAGYHFKSHDNTKKTELISLKHLQECMEDITSPVAKRATSQAAKVINSIIRKMGGSPSYINIELARDLTKSFDERRKIEKRNKDNQAVNQRLKDRIQNEFHKSNATGLDIVKLKLYEEQAGICPYSVKQMDVTRIFDDGYAQIDHIIPYSISFDDRYTNKVLVFTDKNQKKGNKLPMEFLQGKDREQFQVWVNSNVRSIKKKKNLLKEELTEKDQEGFKQRNITDTRTSTRFLFNYLRDYLRFDQSGSERKNRVTSLNGAMTDYMRKRWGLEKSRANGDLHHAMDAVVAAVVTPSLIQKVSRYAKYRETEFVPSETGDRLVSMRTGEVLAHFPQPWDFFRQDLEARLSNNPKRLLDQYTIPNYTAEDIEQVQPVFVSRMPSRRTTGAAHQDTIRSPKALDEGYVVTKKALQDIKLDKKTGEIENYYNPQSDILLYHAIKARLLEYGGDGKKAFQEPFYKPRRDGSQGPLVKKVKLMEYSALYVPLNQNTAVAKNETMVRADIFFVENEGYYIVPIYISDTVSGIMPNKAVTPGKMYQDWKEMNDSDFLFSLYKNDLIYIKSKGDFKMTVCQADSTNDKEYMTKEGFFYYNVTDVANATIGFINHDNSYKSRKGVKQLITLEKWQVDVLGNKSKVAKEPRLSFVKG